MPHLRKRHIESTLASYLKASAIVGVLGQRQTGKTTLCRQFCGDWTSLDRQSDLMACEISPESFLENRKAPFLIDECQFCPPLFPVLKMHVFENKRVGQFLLTGSVRFTSRKAIRESLTGRILNIELLPMTFSESYQLSLSNSLTQEIFKKVPSWLEVKKDIRPRIQWIQYLLTGGLPGICFQRNPKLRGARFQSHLETILDRDLRLVSETNLSKLSLLTVLRALARHQGLPLDWTQLRYETGISTITLKKLFSAFESLFLIRPILEYDKATIKTFYFEDQGIASHLTGFTCVPLINDFTRFLYANLREQFHYQMNLDYEVSCYQTRGGAQIPLVFRSSTFEVGVIPQLEDYPSRSALKSADSFLKKRLNSFLIIVTESGAPRKIRDRLFTAPWYVFI